MLYYSCSSDRKLDTITLYENKGMAIDDSTLKDCADQIGFWPHYDKQIKTIRLFTGWKWDHGYDQGKREEMWEHLTKWVHSANVKVLFGMEFQKGYDDQGWKWTFELMKKIGPNHTFGVGFGNEVDLKGGGNFFSRDGFLISYIKNCLKEMDAAGFDKVPITTVFTAGIIENKDHNNFLKQAFETWGDRWTFSYNPYSIWDSGLASLSYRNCNEAVGAAISVDYVKGMTKNIRAKLTNLVGTNDFRLWLTEAGWSSPGCNIGNQPSIVRACPLWGDKESLWKMYKGLMEWDLTFDDGSKAADHLFWFTLRDSNSESFGLVGRCGDDQCKVQGSALKFNSSSLV